MDDYQFRTNWLGQVILQRRVVYLNATTGWQDATAQDLKDYYAELYELQKLGVAQEQRRLFDSQCG